MTDLTLKLCEAWNRWPVIYTFIIREDPKKMFFLKWKEGVAKGGIFKKDVLKVLTIFSQYFLCSLFLFSESKRKRHESFKIHIYIYDIPFNNTRKCI